MVTVFAPLKPHAPRTRIEVQWLIGANKVAQYLNAPNSVAGLGRIDVCLRTLAPAWFDWVTNPEAGRPMDSIGDYECLSNLWVLGSYEVLRSLKQSLKKKASPQHGAVLAAERMFRRVRIPLAKFEAARAFKFDTAEPGRGFQRERGCCWQMNNLTTVWRVDLSDAFLRLFDQFAHTPVSERFQELLD